MYINHKQGNWSEWLATADFVFNNKVYIATCCSNHSPEWHLQFAYFSKVLSWLSNSGDYKRTQQGAFAILLLYLYKYNVVHATTIYLPHVLLLIHHASYMCPNIILLISAVHVYTMRNYSLLMSSLTLTPSRLFLILLDPKSFQTILASVT